MRTLLVLTTFAVALLATPQPSPCQTGRCGSYVCYDSSGCPGQQCGCIITPGSQGIGRCGWVR